MLRRGAQWNDLPERYPSYQTCHRRFQEWNRNGTMRNILHSLAQDLKERGEIDIEESFIDGTFVPAKKGAKSWQNKAWEGYKDHGNRRQPRSSYRLLHGKCFAP
ncbi:transposase [Leptospira borgpetersenii]|nr:transposase [Leptospira borgpetersenii]MBE8399049.1 transposase [Leptospira borgpetersenii serovar Tarassovi]MBE8402570.1 transposase [Leptospira borgpetersenii serovar Tarassovi]MBE8405078.1 transposase [Leptospira borgpetersenii serovar Tarassovi]MBE8412739.1 transposase [Leptospira borgpetersenii serovar Tarassovi]MBE8415295.1 transposase [Leptospira borgpetersenii serovar Tarassovi]